MNKKYIEDFVKNPGAFLRPSEMKWGHDKIIAFEKKLISDMNVELLDYIYRGINKDAFFIDGLEKIDANYSVNYLEHLISLGALITDVRLSNDDPHINWLKIRGFFEAGKITDTYDLSNTIVYLTPFLAIKRFKNISNNELLLHEYIVATLCTNNLRSICPNYSLVYGCLSCNFDVDTLLGDYCKNIRERSNIDAWDAIIYERIPGPTLEEHIEGVKMEDNGFYLGDFNSRFTKHTNMNTWGYSLESMVDQSINIMQILLALLEGQTECKFTHYDLHTKNIVVRSLEKCGIGECFIKYACDGSIFDPDGNLASKRSNKYIYLRCKYIPTIIDYGMSYINTDFKGEEISLGHPKFVAGGALPMFSEFQDVFKLVCDIVRQPWVNGKLSNELLAIVLPAITPLLDGVEIFDAIDTMGNIYFTIPADIKPIIKVNDVKIENATFSDLVEYYIYEIGNLLFSISDASNLEDLGIVISSDDLSSIEGIPVFQESERLQRKMTSTGKRGYYSVISNDRTLYLKFILASHLTVDAGNEINLTVPKKYIIKSRDKYVQELMKGNSTIVEEGKILSYLCKQIAYKIGDKNITEFSDLFDAALLDYALEGLEKRPRSQDSR